MKIRITNVAPVCPAPRIGEEYEVLYQDEQLPEFGGGVRYHVMCMGREIVVCEKDCIVIE